MNHSYNIQLCPLTDLKSTSLSESFDSPTGQNTTSLTLSKQNKKSFFFIMFALQIYRYHKYNLKNRADSYFQCHPTQCLVPRSVSGTVLVPS